MEMKFNTSVNHTTNKKSKEVIENHTDLIYKRVCEIAKKEREEDITFNEDGSLNLNSVSAPSIHSILLETERLGLSYTIEKSTTIKIQA